MIITDIKQLRDVPLGEIATLIVQFKPVKTSLDLDEPCEGCIFAGMACDCCSCVERYDKEEVKFVKI